MTELQAGWTWLEGCLQPGIALHIEGGRIRSIERATSPPGAEYRDLALFPGFVNAHSHAFQWGLRGRVQGGRGGDFFSWREDMFALAAELDAESIHRLSQAAFVAMRRAGYTTVGEFHYVHHRPDGTPYDRSTHLAEAVIAAARQVGIRICLLHGAYLRPSGVDVCVSEGQRRFLDPGAASFLARHRQLDEHLENLDDERLSLGVAPHSVRTVSGPDLAALTAATTGPLHIHVNEQRREISETLAEVDRRPLDVIREAGALGERTTLVHMTHATEAEIAVTAYEGARICFCPTTERDLGDGIGPSRQAVAAGIPLCIGSDSQAQLDPFEELRLLEGHERLRTEQRLVLPVGDGDSLASFLIDRVGSRGGADALHLHTGAIEAGRWADLVALDLADPDLAGIDPVAVPSAIVFSATPRAVRATWVAGRGDRL